MTPDLPLAEPIPYRDPLDLLAAWGGTPYALLFDSADPADERARYSYLCLDPVETCAVPIDGGTEAGPLAWLDARLRRGRQASRPDLPPFQGGAAGLLGYELGGHLETLPAPAAHGADHPVAALGIYDVVAAFDHTHQRAWLIATGYPETDPAARRARAERRLAALRPHLTEPGAMPAPAALAPLAWESDVAGPAYRDKVARAIQYIHAGDVFQVNLSRELVAPRPSGLRAFALYRSMRRRTLAPFSAYMALPDGRAVCSFSPERFLQADAEGHVETRPIKGTRPRAAEPAEDARLAAELAGSAKDRAENLMIVDLLRNDLARVCRVGSVHVPTLCGLESFRAVHHLVSVVRGELAVGRTPVDLISAGFPGGSITGAPKIRAMEIIRELEGRRRGPYCGSLCWLGFDGAMDSSILIRTMTVEPAAVRYGVGGGVVADSDPEAEWRETEVKAAAFMAAEDAGAGDTETDAETDPDTHVRGSQRHAS
ncbi:aminodeoxychorismate synthase, subunit I [Limimonas halophila]|uniref:aminodeoxychorismate synthase n=1 Tax=Limimonas halophila TaxID=1082479 RepID=A0A1G7S1D1_9PROT|nr:aminodeoxychorismate synthase component I [Limimonas halophila]SDG16817.1 aminodeoxychorismate synthase, subunit I [Limimonas halophila]